MHPPSYHLLRFATLGVLVAMLLLSGCGRKGPLDPPPGASMQPPANAETGDPMSSSNTQSYDFGKDGRPTAPRGQKKKLPGDVLID